MGSSGGKSGTGSQTIRLPPWYESQLRRVNDIAMDQWKMYANTQPPQMSADRTAGLAQMADYARGAGAQLPAEAVRLQNATLRGDYLSPDSNPWLRQVADRAALGAENRINSQYAGSGRYGGGAFANAMADAQMDIRAKLYGDNYAQERGRQMQALALAPQSYEFGTAPGRTLAEVGAQHEAAADRNYYHQADTLGRVASVIYGNPAQRAGKTETSENTKNKFDWAAFVGGLLGGG